MNSKIRLFFSFVVAITLYSCGGIESSNVSLSDGDTLISDNYIADESECLQWLSAAYVNSQNGSYQDCVDAYNISLSEGCGSKYPKKIYQWMGRAYIELDKVDSAKWAVDKGLRILPENLELLNVAAFVSKKQDIVDDELYYLDTKLQLEEEIESMLKTSNIDSSNEEILELQKSLGMSEEFCDGMWGNELEERIKIFRKSRENTYKSLSDLYEREELYDDQIDILNQWQSYSPDNPVILKEKKRAYISLGKNPIDIDKERWKKNPSNIQFGLEYIKKLKEEMLTDEIVEVSLELLDYEKDNINVLENLGQAYLDLYEQDKALKIYNRLLKKQPMNSQYLIEISKIYLDMGEYDKSLEYGDSAVRLNSAEAFNNRAQIYKGIVDSCIGEELTMSDKAVYEMAWEDLNKAIDKGYKRARKDASFLKKNYITESADWFLNVEEGKSTFKPSDPCYSMIDRVLKKRKF